ncbi:MAG: sigma-70 family RNA polymerase sigma factor [Armatimonadota bacterium]|nr:sigma-70 family RNA polymerase sigma factor [Armatimonadota bacterium]MDR5697507.1 sigma-70 family RNA polymerase sigma factor [Armatimonadota bacterium]
MFDDYLKELRKVRTLTAPQERRLWERYKLRGDLRARRRLIEAYQPLVFKTVMALRLPPAVLMDMIQEGTVGLIEAVERFDPARGFRFSTFATYRIRGNVLNALRREKGGVLSLEQELMAHTDLPVATRLADPAALEALGAVEDGVFLEQVLQAIGRLPARERAILYAFFFESKEPQVVAQEMQISVSHMYRLQKQAIARVREILFPPPSPGPQQV